MNERPTTNGLFHTPAYARVLVTTGARTVYASGHVSVDEEGKPRGAGDLAAQAMKHLGLALVAAGTRFADIVKTTTFVIGHRRRQEAVLGGEAADPCPDRGCCSRTARMAYRGRSHRNSRSLRRKGRQQGTRSASLRQLFPVEIVILDKPAGLTNRRASFVPDWRRHSGRAIFRDRLSIFAKRD